MNLNTSLGNIMGRFPVVGQNGYAGEQDDTHVEFVGVFLIPSRKIAQEINIGDAIKIHWAEYHAGRGWKVSFGHWSDDDEDDCNTSQLEMYRYT